MSFTSKDLIQLYQKKKELYGTEAYRHISEILREAKSLHKSYFDTRDKTDHEQSWRAFKASASFFLKSHKVSAVDNNTTFIPGFRKYFETTSRLAGMDLLLINRVMGHSSGLEDSYLKLSEEQILEGNDKMIGYVGAIDDLTINEENRLRRQVETLKVEKSKIDALSETIAEEKSKLGI